MQNPRPVTEGLQKSKDLVTKSTKRQKQQKLERENDVS